MKQIPLTRGAGEGLFAVVDDDDYERLKGYEWQASVRKEYTTYAMRREYQNGKRITIWMHREVIDAKAGQQVDHRNGDGLSNWKRESSYL